MILNQVVVIGNLVRHSEFKRTSGGAGVLTMRLAVNDGYFDKSKAWVGQPVFIDVVVFGEGAETGEGLVKGDRVLVTGKLKYEEWEGKDGTKRSAIKISAHKVSRPLSFEKVPEEAVAGYGKKREEDEVQGETDDDNNERGGSCDDLPF